MVTFFSRWSSMKERNIVGPASKASWRWAECLSLLLFSLCVFFRAVTWSQRLRATVAWTIRCWLERLPASSPCLRASYSANGPTSLDSTKSRSDHSSCLFISVPARHDDLTRLWFTKLLDFSVLHYQRHRRGVVYKKGSCSIIWAGTFMVDFFPNIITGPAFGVAGFFDKKQFIFF